jgi:hypothetical protein
MFCCELIDDSACSTVEIRSCRIHLVCDTPAGQLSLSLVLVSPRRQLLLRYF